MKTIYLDHLFEKHILVAVREHAQNHPFEVVYSLAALFNIRITEGEKLAQEGMIPYVSEKLGVNVPEPFYRGFPESVRTLSTDQLLVDQLLHYAQTYGLGIFDGDAGHSLFESCLERTAFREQAEIRDFVIITAEEAGEKIAESVSSLLESTRPLNDEQYALVLEYLKDHAGEVDHCASKNTAVRLLSDSRNMSLVRFLTMSDVLKLVDSLGGKPDLIILDPPRDGIHPKAMPKILSYGVEQILYISCKPTSLARDLPFFYAAGYRAVRGMCLDQFPWTTGVETVCLLSNR